MKENIEATFLYKVSDQEEWFINNVISLINGETLIAQKENRDTNFIEIKQSILKMLRDLKR